jgi:glycosyltransferase involved in cell wall biosynthesis
MVGGKKSNKINPLFSIITVVKDCKNDIEKTILSVVKQEYPSFEYIIIDGGSADGTLEIIKNYECTIDSLVTESDNGTYYAMNKGLSIAKGQWINFMNAGDKFLDSSVLAKVSSHLKMNNMDILYGSTLVAKGNNRKLVRPRPLHKIANGRMVFVHQSSFVKRSVINELGFNEKYKINSDYDLFLQLYSRDFSFSEMDEVISIYKAGGLTYKYRFQGDKEKLQILAANNYPNSMIRIKLLLRQKIKELVKKRGWING